MSRRTMADVVKKAFPALKIPANIKATPQWKVHEKLRKKGMSHEEIMVMWGKPTFHEFECLECGDIGRFLDGTLCECLKSKMRARLFDGAAIPKGYEAFTLETFPWEREDPENKGWVYSWLEGLEGMPSLFLHGASGRGKTGIAIGVLKVFTERLEGSLFVTVPDFMEKLRATQKPNAEHTESELLDAAREVPLLVLDDIGRERPTAFTAECLFRLINHRYAEQMTTVFTSNLTPDEIVVHLGEATGSRVLSNSLVVHLHGDYVRGEQRQLAEVTA